MEKSKISNNLLYSQQHFDLLIKLYRTTFGDTTTLDKIYDIITEVAAEGLNVDRASYWKITEDRLVCINMFDRESGLHSTEEDLFTKDYPIYFKALREGIAIVADHAQSNKYTAELKDTYLRPKGITDIIDLPIRENGILIGVLSCENRDDAHVWSDSDLTFARSIADILSLMRENNKRRDAEVKLREGERKLRLITQNSTDGFVVFENKHITFISPSYLDLLGYTEEEASKLTFNDLLKSIHPDDVKKAVDIIDENIARKTKHFRVEFRFKGKKGRYFWREDTFSVLYDEEGRYDKHIIISRDISKLKKAEHGIQKLYTILKSQNEKLLDFTHIISHNIRSNTSNISMLIDLIEETEDTDEKEEYFKLLKQSNNKLSETIRYLNETISLQLTSKDLKKELNVKTELENILSSINGIIKKEKAEINIDVPKDMDIKTVPSYFESIMFNLISNAIKYRSPDRHPVVNIKAEKVDSKYIFTVGDNGLGIDMGRNKEKIFGMYRTFHGNKDAIGLGLFMTKNHVEALGGTIEVESEVGKGSEFKFILHE